MCDLPPLVGPCDDLPDDRTFLIGCGEVYAIVCLHRAVGRKDHDHGTGKMYVNFLSDNDITGGNSGSPVLNAEGDLVGLAFDGNKEGLTSDMYYDPVMNKCISVDIRYVMWILDKYMGMDYLFDELTFVPDKPSLHKSGRRNADRKRVK